MDIKNLISAEDIKAIIAKNSNWKVYVQVAVENSSIQMFELFIEQGEYEHFEAAVIVKNDEQGFPEGRMYASGVGMVRAYDLCRLDKIDNEIRSFVYSKRP
jgi:hypothetical protein